jgi:tetratricopeptide (TPR) repeat protein
MTSLFLSLLCAAGLCAQDPDAELKKRILDKVREKLAAERSALLKRVEAIIDEELSKGGPAAKPAPAGEDQKTLEKKLRAIEEEKELVEIELAKKKRLALDEPVKAEAKKSGPHDEEEAEKLFQEALALHEAKKFEQSIRLFKRVYYQYPAEPVGFTSAYNVACGYALWGRKDEALDWLEISVKGGFGKIDHLRKDTDLDSLRNEKRYRRLLTDR